VTLNSTFYKNGWDRTRFFITEGRTTPLYLSDEDLLITRNNSRVRRLEAYKDDNTTEKLFLIYYDSKKLRFKNAIPVTYRYNIWFRVGERDGRPILGEPLIKIRDFDLPDERYDQESVKTTQPS
jgi:hypothetical protein